MSTHSGQFIEEDRISAGRKLLMRLHIDLPMLVSLLLLAGLGLFVLYSAGEQNSALVVRQLIRLAIAFGVMFALAQIPPMVLRRWAPWLFGIGLILLFAVLLLGVTGKGAQRWLDLGLFTFQPSELMKLAVPLMIAAYLADAPLPPSHRRKFIASIFLLLPTLLVAKQPDLGTAILIASSGFFVLFLAGLSWRLMISLAVLAGASMPLLWQFVMHDYQKQRVLTLLNPESDPLGAGYHTIQSTIAIGSGGLYGKGWLHGTQSHLDFLPERSTDFIFAVYSEEFGFIGSLLLLAIYLTILARGMVIATQAQDTFSRLVAGGLTLTFFVYFFVNMGMVSGILPVVGLPLPLVSYGGTSMVTMMAAFGILMSIHTHRRLMAT
ncbi:MAG TPA: rod shape-determining protein RodA [Gammaproteobacteria bacterium]|nr:rod shape-determining protein RodA [Gammaproteobacteria bacterium]